MEVLILFMQNLHKAESWIDVLILFMHSVHKAESLMKVLILCKILQALSCRLISRLERQVCQQSWEHVVYYGNSLPSCLVSTLTFR